MQTGKLYYSIGEVAQLLDVNASLLRYWETEFNSLKPIKNKKGDRSYTEKDIELLKRIHYLTRECGYTLDGAREQLRKSVRRDDQQEAVRRLKEAKAMLEEIEKGLRKSEKTEE